MTQHPKDPANTAAYPTEEQAKMCRDQWGYLPKLEPSVLLSFFAGSPNSSRLQDVLSSIKTEYGNTWHQGYFFNERNLVAWARSRGHCRTKDTRHNQLSYCRTLSTYSRPKALHSPNPQVAAEAWDGIRLAFIRAVADAIHVGNEHVDIFFQSRPRNLDQRSAERQPSPRFIRPHPSGR